MEAGWHCVALTMDTYGNLCLRGTAPFPIKMANFRLSLWLALHPQFAEKTAEAMLLLLLLLLAVFSCSSSGFSVQPPLAKLMCHSKPRH